MESNLLEKVTKIVEKTKDRVIVIDAASQKAFALMPLDDYEAMVFSKDLILGKRGMAVQPKEKDLRENILLAKAAGGAEGIGEKFRGREGAEILRMRQKTKEAGSEKSGVLEEEERYFLEPLE